MVTYHFPSDSAIGGMRWAGITKYLGRIGWHSWVVTAAPTGLEGPPEVTVERHRRRTTIQDLYRRARARRRHTDNGQLETRSTASVSAVRTTWFARVRAEASILLSLPDRGRGWIIVATRATRRLIAREQPAAVVSSGPPHSAHLVAWLATRGMKRPWFVDLRDPWNGPHGDAWKAGLFYRSMLARWLRAWLERKVFAAATAVVCNTKELASALAQLYPTTPFHWIPNGADPEALPRLADEPFPGLGLVHAGTIYGGRDPGPVLLALRQFLDRYPEARTGTRFRIAGEIAPSYAETLRRQVADLGLAAWIETLGVLSREDALAVVARSRLAIVLAQGQDFQVPAKLYEMVLLGTPTVVIAAPHSAAASEAARLGAFAVTPDDTEALARVMQHAWHAPRAAAGARGSASYAVITRQVEEMLGGGTPRRDPAGEVPQ